MRPRRRRSGFATTAVLLAVMSAGVLLPGCGGKSGPEAATGTTVPDSGAPSGTETSSGPTSAGLPGTHIVAVRASTADEVQTDVKKKSFPDGATGHHEVHVRVVR